MVASLQEPWVPESKARNPGSKGDTGGYGVLRYYLVKLVKDPAVDSNADPERYVSLIVKGRVHGT